jgi:site-specific recombinase XerD
MFCFGAPSFKYAVLARAIQLSRTAAKSPFAPFTTAGWRKMVARLGVAAKLGFKAHPPMFRHACGFQLANQGTDTRTLQAYLGHRNIQHTVRYTELSPTRFKNLWRD